MVRQRSPLWYTYVSADVWYGWSRMVKSGMNDTSCVHSLYNVGMFCYTHTHTHTHTLSHTNPCMAFCVLLNCTKNGKDLACACSRDPCMCARV